MSLGQHKNNRTKPTLLLALVLFTSVSLTSSTSADWKDPVSQIKKFGRHVQNISRAEEFGGAFRLKIGNGSDLDSALSSALKERLLNPKIKLNVLKSKGNALALTENNDYLSFSRDYNFMAGDFPLCEFEIRAHKIRGLKSPVVMGLIPDVNFEDVPSKNDWPTLNDSKEAVIKQLSAKKVNVSSSKILEKSRCLYVQDQDLIPAWEMIVRVNGRPYSAIADSENAYKVEPRFFDVTGTAETYVKNPLDGNIETYKLKNLVGNGYLENGYFDTHNERGNAYETTHVFDYPTNDDRFAEVALFVHANTQLEFFQSLGYKWTSKGKITLVAHYSDIANNAMYTPASGSDGATIKVHDGDGVKLANLPLDTDVVSHEFGHHVIFETLTATSGESLVIHEGMADYFTFARTGDDCLGESICPVGSTVGCEINGQCLRTADNDYIYGVNTKSEAHLKSQFLSGMLWDLRGNEVPAERLDEIAYRGVDLLHRTSGYHDLILGFMLADKEYYNGKYCDAIYAKAQDRGLSSTISDLDCDNIPDDAFNELNNSETDDTNIRTKEGRTSLLPWCGVSVNTDRSGFAGLLSILIFLLIPVAVALPKLKAERVRANDFSRTKRQ